MFGSLRLDHSQRWPVVILGVGFGLFCILFAFYPRPGQYSLFGGITVHDRGEFSILGVVVIVGLALALYVLLTGSRYQEWEQSLGRPVQLLLAGLFGVSGVAIIQLALTTISTKTMLVGLGVSALVLTFTSVVRSRYAGTNSSIETG